jgi:hypothetical protein
MLQQEMQDSQEMSWLRTMQGIDEQEGSSAESEEGAGEVWLV